MAERKSKGEKPSKAAKKPKKSAVPEPPKEPAAAMPSSSEIRQARKAELVSWSERYGLSAEGKVDELRKRLLAFVAKETKKEPPKEEPGGIPEKPTAEPKRKAKEKPAKRAKARKEGEEADEEEAEPHEARAKPKLDPRLRKLLSIRAAKNAQRPRFRRQEWFRYRKFGHEWRKPQGGQSKLRRHFGYRWNVPSIGYRGPRAVRGLHPSGFQEVLVHNERQLDGLDASRQAVRIAHAVGARKRERIEKACDDKGLRVLNRMVTD